MKIGIDATQLSIDKGGVHRYLWDLIQALKRIDKNNEYVVLFSFLRKSGLASYGTLRSSLCDASNFRTKWLKLPNAILWPLRIPIDIFVPSLDILHGAGHFVSPTLSAKSVVTIHDLDYLNIPHLLDKNWVKRKAAFTRASVLRSKLVITVSEFVKRELIEKLSVDAGKIHVVYHGVSAHYEPVTEESRLDRIRKKYGIAGSYILFVGSFHFNKNLLMLLEAFKKCKKIEGFSHSLVLAGWQGRTYDSVMARITSLNLTEDVIVTGHVSEQDLPVLYSAGELLVLPSVYEGFGLPAIEAMACGTPVVCSNAGSLPEIVGEAAYLVDPQSVDSLASAILNTSTNETLRGSLRRRGLDRAKMFSWENAARQTLSIYEEVMKG
jgi:glycosyltransferase involved in cell wall biosynthesis